VYLFIIVLIAFAVYKYHVLLKQGSDVTKSVYHLSGYWEQ